MLFAFYSNGLVYAVVFFELEMKGDLILQFEPQPLPAPSDRSQDNDLDISLEQESACDTQQELEQMIEEEVSNESESKAFKLYVYLKLFGFIVEEI